MENILQEMGLSERESKIYLALLDLGSSTVGPIAAKTRIQHPKIYQTLEKLIDKGLVSFVVQGRAKQFQALPPKKLMAILKEKENKLSEILPALELRKKFAEEQQISIVYEGYNAIKTMYDELFDELDSQKGFYYVFALRDEYKTNQIAAIFFKNIHTRLEETKIEDKIIADNTIKDAVKTTFSNNKNINMRFTKLQLPVGLVITKNHVINMVWGERPTAIVITSPQIAAHYKQFFLNIWDEAKE